MGGGMHPGPNSGMMGNMNGQYMNGGSGQGGYNGAQGMGMGYGGGGSMGPQRHHQVSTSWNVFKGVFFGHGRMTSLPQLLYDQLLTIHLRQ